MKPEITVCVISVSVEVERVTQSAASCEMPPAPAQMFSGMQLPSPGVNEK